MSRLTVLVSNRIPAEHLPTLRNRFPDVSFIHLPENGSVPPDGRSAEVLLRCGMPKPALQNAIDGAPALRWLHTCTAGFDWLLIPSVMERGLLISRTTSAYNTAISEVVLAYMLFVAKRFPDLLRAQAACEWAPPEPDELTTRTVGVIGAGSIGSEIAKRCAAFGMRTIATKRTPGPVAHFDEVVGPDGLPRLLAESDYVVLSCPLTTETRGMIAAAQLRLMKPTAYLINIARGALIVEADFIQAMQEGWIAGALLDAFEKEPLPADSPLWKVPNVVIAPHYSYKSPFGMQRIVEEFSQNLTRYLAGEPLKNMLGDAALGY